MKVNVEVPIPYQTNKSLKIKQKKGRFSQRPYAAYYFISPESSREQNIFNLLLRLNVVD